MTAKDFLEYYSNVSDADLIFILDNELDYQQPAIEAAKAEFARRCLTQEQIDTARSFNSDHAIQKYSGTRKVFGFRVIRQPERTILIVIILIFTSLFVYQISRGSLWLELYVLNFFNHPLRCFVGLLPS